MTKTLQRLKTAASILLGIGTLLVFNESDTFIPNIIGLVCGVTLFYLNKDENERVN